MRVFIFLHHFSERFLILRRSERDRVKKFIGLRVNYHLSLPDFNKTETFSRDFRKNSNIILHENPSGGSRVVPCGRTDRHNDVNSGLSQFCERA